MDIKTYPAVADSTAVSFPKEEPDPLKKKGITLDQLGVMFGQIAQAIAGNVPNSWQAGLGRAGESMARESAYQKASKSVEAGQTPDTRALTPEHIQSLEQMKATKFQQKMATDQADLASRSLDIEADRAGSYEMMAKAQQAQAENQMPWEEQKKLTLAQINKSASKGFDFAATGGGGGVVYSRDTGNIIKTIEATQQTGIDPSTMNIYFRAYDTAVRDLQNIYKTKGKMSLMMDENGNTTIYFPSTEMMEQYKSDLADKVTFLQQTKQLPPVFQEYVHLPEMVVDSKITYSPKVEGSPKVKDSGQVDIGDLFPTDDRAPGMSLQELNTPPAFNFGPSTAPRSTTTATKFPKGKVNKSIWED